MKKQLYVLLSPGFLGGLVALLLNDFVLKQQFHNWLTGKLSDVAGMFVFPLFWVAFFPKRRGAIYLLTGVSFTLWKSIYSQPLIEEWNSLPFFSIARTVDYSDLVVLVLLPVSYFYGRFSSETQVRRTAVCLVATISLIAFGATQFSKKTSYGNEYRFNGPKKRLVEQMSHLPSHDAVSSSWEYADTFEITFDSCTGRAAITIREADAEAIITLKEIDYRCPSGGDKQKLLEYFEKEFIDKLKSQPVERSSQIQYIGASPSDSPHAP